MKKLFIALSLLIFGLTAYAYTYGPWQLIAAFPGPGSGGYMCKYARDVYNDNGTFYKREIRDIGAVRTGMIGGAPVYKCMPPNN